MENYCALVCAIFLQTPFWRFFFLVNILHFFCDRQSLTDGSLPALLVVT